MHEAKQIVVSDHEDQFAQTFENINNLINADSVEEAVDILKELHYADLADFLDNAHYRIYDQIFPLITDHLKPETLVYLSRRSAKEVLEILGFTKSAHLIDQLDIEDAIDVIENIDEETKDQILKALPKTKRQQVLEGLNYPENTAGRVLERDFISFQSHWTTGQAIEALRKRKEGGEFHAAIIVDSKYRPVGTILLSTLLHHTRATLLKDLINSDYKAADQMTELSELAFIFKQYALTIVPVVNKNGKLVGTISIDSMLYIIEEQASKNIMQLGGIHSEDIFDNLFITARHRFPWLFVNLLTACITAFIISQFSNTISKLVTIAAIMPIVASMGGNAGTQSMTVTVRALANKDINSTNIFKVILKELLVCTLNGFLLACIGASMSFAIIGNMELSLIFACAVIINFLIAGICGSVIPITLHQFHIDPAAASGVFLTAITDGLGFLIFLGLACLFLV